jgi:hypothetical protein
MGLRYKFLTYLMFEIQQWLDLNYRFIAKIPAIAHSHHLETVALKSQQARQ